MKERTQRRGKDLEQNTEKRKKLRGSCTYIQPESNSLGRYLVPRSTCEILSASTCAVTTAQICKRRLCYRKQNGLSDHEESCIRMDLRKEDFAAEQKQVSVIMAHRILLWFVRRWFTTRRLSEKTNADVSVMSLSNKPCRKLQRKTTIIMIPQSSKSKFCSQANIPWPQGWSQTKTSKAEEYKEKQTEN